MSSRRQGLWLISVLTLAAQLLGLAHLAVETHTLSLAGYVVEPGAIDADAHEDAAPHLCDAAGPGLHGPDEACAVAASWTTSGVLGEVHASLSVEGARVHQRAPPGWWGADDDVLARAPKASPPAA